MENFTKKRTIIAIIITTAALAVLSRYWLIVKPFHIGFDIAGKNICNIEVVVNKKDNASFDKTRSEFININLDENSHADFYIKSSSAPKRLKIVISDINPGDKLILSNIQSENLKPDRLNEFDITGANVEKDGNKLILQAENDTISLIYPHKLQTKINFSIDFKILIIAIILIYLLSYKITSYLADFKTVQGKSRIEIIFLTIFFIFLFVPMCHINKEEISKQENRTLAVWQPIINENNEINFEFGKNFNDWFNDRFFMRQNLINTYYSLRSGFSKYYYEDKTIIYNKKADFSYNKMYNSVNRFLKKDLFTQDELEIIYKNISALNTYCRKNNVELYIMLSNDKESIYPEFYPDYYIPDRNISRLEQVKELLKNVPDLKVVSPTKNLLETKSKEMVFLPYDTHLNGLGIYIEYQTLISEISKLFPNIKPIEFSETEIIQNGQKGDSIPPKKYSNEKYEYVDFINIKNANAVLYEEADFKDKSYFFKQFINEKAGNNLNLVIIGDSFHGGYLPLLAESFHNVKSLFVGHGKNFILDYNVKNLLFDDKPDILIIETTERFLQRLLALDSFEELFVTEGKN